MGGYRKSQKSRCINNKQAMMKKVFVCALVFALGITFKPALAQSYSGNECYGDVIGDICGTEKYNYVVNDYGEKIANGNYTFSGKKTLSDSQTTVTGTYSLNAVVSKGNLSGTYTQSATYSGKKFEWPQWVPFSASSKLTGTFKDGEPNGLFSCSLIDGTKRTASATLKDSLYVGTYSFTGYGDRSEWITLKGQLTNDGRLTGKWQYDNAGIFTMRYEFLNDIAISIDNGSNVTPPAVQALAKKFANNAITEDELKKQGIYVIKSSLPLDLAVYLFLHNEFGMNTIPAKRSFKKYACEKDFKYLKKLNTFTEEGWKMFLNFVKTNGCEEDYEEAIGNYYARCYTEGQYDDQYNCYSVVCNYVFSNKYTNIHTSSKDPVWVYFSDTQLQEYYAAMKEYYSAIAYPFDQLFNKSSQNNAEYCKAIWKVYVNNPDHVVDTLSTYSAYHCKEMMRGMEETISYVRYHNFCDSAFVKYNDAYYSVEENCMKNLQGLKNLLDSVCNLKYDYQKRIRDIKYSLQQKTKYYNVFDPLFEEMSAGDNYIKGDKYLEQLTEQISQLDSIDILDNKIKKQCEPFIGLTNVYKTKSCTIKTIEDIQTSFEQLNSFSMNIDRIEELYNKIVEQCARCSNYSIACNTLIKEITISELKDADQLVETLEKLSANLEAFITNENTIKSIIFDYASKSLEQYRKYATKTLQPLQKNILPNVDLIYSLTKTQETFLQYLDVHGRIETKSNSILNCGQDNTIKAYNKYIKGYNFVWTIDASLQTIIDVEKTLDNCIAFIEEVQKVNTNHETITQEAAMFKDIQKSYQAYYKSLDLVWAPEKDTQALLDIQKKQSNCIAFIVERKNIADNENTIISLGSKAKNILKAYQSHMKGVDVSWTTEVSLQKLLDIQDTQKTFINALNSSAVHDLDNKIKNSKDKSLDNILNILRN